MSDDTDPDEESQPYFSQEAPPDPDEVKRRKRAEYQRNYRNKRKLDVSDSPDVPDLKSSTSSLHGEDVTRNIPRKQSTRKTRNKGALPDMAAKDYAIAFQALHMVGAGVTGQPGIAISDDEAAPVGNALKVVADYYGWDPLEKFGPLFLLGIQLSVLEAKVFKRVRVQAPEVRRLKQEAKARKRGDNIIPMPTPVEPTTPVEEVPLDESVSPVRKLRLLEELASQVPDGPTLGFEPGPTS
jgi:hypothetical protein